MALSYVGYVLADAQIYQACESWRLEHSAKRNLRALPAGLIIGKVQIPRVGLSAVVVQGDSQEILSRAVGHVPGTALPGQSGNVVIAGHRDSFFRSLRKVHAGDRIVLKTPAAFFDYEVESTSVVAPTDLSAIQDSRQPQLTLITCYPFSWIGSAPNRFIVRARQIDFSPSSARSISQP
jgi:sortase A